MGEEIPQIIKKLRTHKNPALSKFKFIIEKATNRKDIEDLPSTVDFSGSEKICMFCEYCEHSKVFFKTESKKLSRSTFNFLKI